MPVVVMHGGSGAGCGNSALSTKSTGPNSHMCLSLVVFLLNPLFGLFALIFSCWSRQTSSMDWDGAQTKGRIALWSVDSMVNSVHIALWLAIAGVVTSVVAALVFVLLFFTKDT